MSASRAELRFLFGIRGLSSVYVLLFHLNYIVLAALPGEPPRLYRTLTDWIRYGDFRVAAFFVISGYLLTIPIAKRADWALPSGVRAFLERRARRLLGPYYVAFALSLVLYVAWQLVVGEHVSPKLLAAAIVSHALVIHNVFPQTMLLVNDTLWNVGLEFQCYALFALALIPLMRRVGPVALAGIVLAASLVPHVFFHGFLDWMRLWFVALYAFGVSAMAISNRTHPELQRYERAIPWGAVALVAFVLTPFAIRASGMDAPYGAGWLQNLLLGLSVAAFLIYVRTGMRGPFAPLARAVVRFLDLAPLRRLGAFSYSIYLIHYPLLRLMVGITSRFTHSAAIVGVLALTVYVPITLGLAFLFHVRVERPFAAKEPKGDTAAVTHAVDVPALDAPAPAPALAVDAPTLAVAPAVGG